MQLTLPHRRNAIKGATTQEFLRKPAVTVTRPVSPAHHFRKNTKPNFRSSTKLASIHCAALIGLSREINTLPIHLVNQRVSVARCQHRKILIRLCFCLRALQQWDEATKTKKCSHTAYCSRIPSRQKSPTPNFPVGIHYATRIAPNSAKARRFYVDDW
jgi:hypothetical protein